jgi:hypothetical protein
MGSFRGAFLLVGLGTITGLGTVHADGPDLNGLVANSPFGKAGQAPDAAGTTGPLELRGVFIDQGERFFSLYDVSSRRALWVGLKEPGNPFVVQAYDEAQGVVTVEYQGQVHAVTLKQAKVAALPVPVGPGPSATPAGSPGPAVQTAPDEAARLAQIAEEIRRRRALRAQAAQMPRNQPPSPVPSPATSPAAATPPRP